jgi:predicted RecA/RadA family phage recombinase
MAINEIYEEADEINVVQAGRTSGDPMVFGQIPGVAETTSDTNNNVTMDTDGIFSVSVKGIDQSGNKAIAAGDILYYTAADTPPLSAKNTGVRWGYAMAAVTSGATATILAKVGY